MILTADAAEIARRNGTWLKKLRWKRKLTVAVGDARPRTDDQFGSKYGWFRY
jgi:hypothetical protein